LQVGSQSVPVEERGKVAVCPAVLKNACRRSREAPAKERESGRFLSGPDTPRVSRLSVKLSHCQDEDSAVNLFHIAARGLNNLTRHSVHTTRIHGPWTRAVNTGVILDIRVHGPSSLFKLKKTPKIVFPVSKSVANSKWCGQQ